MQYENCSTPGFGPDQKSGAFDFRDLCLPLLCSPVYMQKAIGKECTIILGKTVFYMCKVQVFRYLFLSQILATLNCMSVTQTQMFPWKAVSNHSPEGIQKGPFSLRLPHFFECKISFRLSNYLIIHGLHHRCWKSFNHVEFYDTMEI